MGISQQPGDRVVQPEVGGEVEGTHPGLVEGVEVKVGEVVVQQEVKEAVHPATRVVVEEVVRHKVNLSEKRKMREREREREG